MEKNDLLPIGSVVLLKGGKHRLMVIGYSPQSNEGKIKVYDYWACFYPEGLLKPNETFVFNRDRIEKVFSLGYSDEEEKTFRTKMNKILNDVKDENGNIKLNDTELSKYLMNVIVGGKK